MTKTAAFQLRKAKVEDAESLARLIDIAGEGIPSWLWSMSAKDGESPLDVGIARASRTSGGFTFLNAIVAEREGDILGMALSYPIDDMPQDDPDSLPAPIAPFVELEAHSVGTWFVNALAVRTGQRGDGIGTALLREVVAMAEQAGYPALTIQVFGQNVDALRLYERFGFEICAQTPVRQHPCQPYYTGDVLVLRKRISKSLAA